jgi:hypothetical protein
MGGGNENTCRSRTHTSETAFCKSDLQQNLDMECNWMAICRNAKREEPCSFERWEYVWRKELAGGNFRKYLRTGKEEREVISRTRGFFRDSAVLLERCKGYSRALTPFNR